MSDNRKADSSQTVIYHEDAPTLPPPRLEVGAVAWMRQNLFGSPTDIVITILSTLLIIGLVVSFFDWAIRSANWYAVINNQRLFMLDRLEPAFEWRVALTVLISALLTGISFAVWARRSMRVLTWFALATVAIVGLLPPIIDATLSQPPSYFAAGNVEIIDRASTLLPQSELAFISQAGETVEVSIATRATSDIDNLRQLSGFADRTTNALSNAAENRVTQRQLTSETFESMISGELTEALEERTRLAIRTFVRTNNMVASTIEFATRTRDNLADGTWTSTQLEVWLTRLETAVDSLEAPDEAILTAIDAVSDAIDELEAEDALGAGAMETVDTLTMSLMASDELEAIGEALVEGITVDLIGEEAQPDEAEDLISPTEPEAEFLHDMFVALLAPQSVLETYEVNQTPMSIEILDGQTLDILAEGVVTPDGESVSVEIPADGWYVLRKVPVEGENGTAILAVRGVFPIVERTLSANESQFVRLTDNDLSVTASRPVVDGEEIPFAVLIDNQYRGLRDLTTYLIHFIPLFFDQVSRLLVPFLLVVAWGFAVGRAIAHLLGENTHFHNTTSRVSVIGLGLSPFLIVLAYFGLIDGNFGFSPISGIVGAVINFVLVAGAIFLAGQIDAWLNRMNSGEDAEKNITSSLIYTWGMFPIVMYVLASGIGNFSGATLGSMIGGLIWLGIMYLVGLNYRGMVGYALLVGGFLLQIAQTHVVDAVWDSWTDSDPTFVLIWLILVGIGIGAGLLGYRVRDRIDFASKRLGYMLGTLGFAFVFVEVSGDIANNPMMIAVGFVFLLWLMWMFFNGTHAWTPTRVLIGILFVTYLAMEVFTPTDKWSIIYFSIWLGIGGYVFLRGVEAQRDLRKPVDNGSLLSGNTIPALIGAVIAWVIALLAVPGFILSLDASGVLQTSPDELLPLSDKRAWGGLMLTMQLTILGVGASFPIGLALALGRRSNLPVVKSACILYIETVRGVPLITVLFLATLLVPLVDPTLATIEGTVRVWVGVTMFSAAYLAENVRGGLQSIPRGQTEAAQAIGLSQWQTTVNILLPQALRAVIPALVGQFISLFKDTSLVVIVGLAEITGIANRVVAQPEFLQKRQETYLYIAIIYFVFSYIMSYISRRVEETGSGAARARQI